MPASLLIGVGTGILAITGDAVASTSGIDHGPLYGFFGVIIAAIITTAGVLYANRRRRLPETPDVALKLDKLAGAVTDLGVGLAEVRTKIEDDRLNVAARLVERDKVTDEKIAASRHEMKNEIQKLVLVVNTLDKHLRPWPTSQREDASD